MRTPGVSGNLAFNEGVFAGTAAQFFGPFSDVTTNASTGAIAGLPVDIVGGAAYNILFLTGAQVGGVNYTLPTVASVIAFFPAVAQQDVPGWVYYLRIINNASGQTITVATNTGWTLSAGGVFTIANNTWRDFIVNITSPTTATITDIGNGTYT